MLLIVVEWEWSVVQSIPFSSLNCPTNSPSNTIKLRFGILLSSLDAVEPSDFQSYVCLKLLLVHRSDCHCTSLLLLVFFTHQVYAQMLVPSLVKNRFEQQSLFFLPSYSSSVFVQLNIVIHLNIVVPLNIVVSLNIVFWIMYFDIIEYFLAISTNTHEGQAWKQASLCLSLDCLVNYDNNVCQQ